MTTFRKKLLVSLVAVAVAASLVYFFLAPAFAGGVPIPSRFSLGPVSVRLYSLTFLTGVIAAFFVASILKARFGISAGELENLFSLAVLGGLIGARAHHVLSEWSYYSVQPEMILRFWRGGLGLYGGIAGATLAVACYCRIRRLDFWKAAGLLAVPLPLAQALGRWGNFFNQEAYGVPTALPWKMHIDLSHRLPEYWASDFFHPWFLYESLADFGIFLTLWQLVKQDKTSGRGLLLVFLLLYSMARFLLEPLRADAAMVGDLYLNQVLALLVCGIAILFLLQKGKATG